MNKYLQLQGNLCYGRNYVNRYYIEKEFPLDKLSNELKSSLNFDCDIPVHVKAALLNILTYVYVDFIALKTILPLFTKRLQKQETDHQVQQVLHTVQESYHLDQSRDLGRNLLTNRVDNESIDLDELDDQNRAADNSVNDLIEILQLCVGQIDRQNNCDEDLIYSSLIFFDRILNFKFLNLNKLKDKQILLYLMKTISQYLFRLCQSVHKTKQKTTRLGVMQEQNLSRHLLNIAITSQTTNNKAVINAQIDLIQEKVESVEQHIVEDNASLMKQKIYIEIIRNMISFMNLRYDYTIKKTMEFFRKIYHHQDDANFQINDFIRDNISKYMPSQSRTKKAQGLLADIDNAIFFDDKGVSIGQEAFNLQILQLFRKNNNYLMELKFLRILFRISLQNTKFVEDLKHYQVLVTPSDNVAYSQIKAVFCQFQFDAEQSEIWLNSNEAGSTNKQMNRLIEKTNQLNDLFFEDQIEQHEQLNNKHKVLQSRQIQYRHLDTQYVFCALLGESLDLFKKIKSINQDNQFIVQMIRNIFKFLTLFVSNNNTINKQLLNPYLDMFLESITFLEIGQTSLLCEIYENNKEKLRHASSLSKPTINSIFKQIITQKRFISVYPRFLQIILKNKNNLHHVIQYISSSNCVESLLCLSDGPELFDTNESANFEPFLYHSKILLFFNNIIEKNYVSQTQFIQQELRLYLDLTKILNFLCKPDIFSPNQKKENAAILMLTFIVKEQLIRLLMNVWVGNYKFSQTLENQIDFNSLCKFVKIESDKIKNHENLKRNFEVILQNYHTDKNKLLEAFTDADNHDNLNPLLQGQLSTLQLYCNTLDLSQYNTHYHYYQLAYIFPFFNTIQSFRLSASKEILLLNVYNDYLLYFKQIIDQDYFPQGILEQYPDFQKILQMVEKQYVNFNHSLHEQFVFQLPENLQLYTVRNRIQKKEPVIEYLMQDMLLNQFGEGDFQLWKGIIVNIVTSDYVQKEFCLMEQIEMLEILKKIQNKKHFNIIIQKMITFVTDTLKENYQRDSLNEEERKSAYGVCIDVLFLLKLIIENAELLGESPYQYQQKDNNLDTNNVFQGLDMSWLKKQDQGKEDNKQKKEPHKTPIERMQHKFSDKSIIFQIISNLCIKEIDDDLFYSHIDLLISILNGGNDEAQEQLYSYFISHNNTEEFFERIEFIINDEMNKLDKQEGFDIKLFRSIAQLSDQNKDLNNNQSKIGRLIRFLQLLAEGHFEKLQGYVREQPNLKKSINLLSILVKFAEKLLKNLSEFNYHELIQVLDTLIEFMQGPCFENQQYLSKMRLIDIILIVLDNYESIESDFMKYYKELQRGKGLLNQKGDLDLIDVVSYDTKSLFEKNKQKFRLSRHGTEQIIQDQAKKISLRARRISISSNFSEIDIDKYEELVTRAIGNLDPSLNVKIIDILRQYQPEYQPWMIRRLQNKILILLDSLIEGVKEDDDILKIFQEKITVNILIRNLSGLYTQYKIIFKEGYTDKILNDYNSQVNKPSNKAELILENGFRIFGLLQSQRSNYTTNGNFFDLEWIHTIIKVLKEENSIDQKLLKEALDFFKDKIGFVEICKDDSIHGVYFPKPPYFKNMTPAIRQRFIIDVDRSNQKSKLEGLMQSQRDIVTDLKYISSLIEDPRFIIFSFLARNLNVLKVMLFIINLTQNILLLVMLKDDHEFTMEPIYLSSKEQYLNTPLENFPIMLLLFECFQIFFSFLIILIHTGTLINKAQIGILDDKIKNMGKIGRINELLQNNYTIMVVIIKDNQFYLKLGYFVLSIFGLFNPSFIAILLLDIFFQVRVFQEILLSIWRPIRQIMLLIFVFVLMQYLYAIIIYYGFSEFYIIHINAKGEVSKMGKDGEYETGTEHIDICFSLLTCFSTLFDLLFKIDGGQTGMFNDIQKKIYYEDFRLSPKVFFDFIYVFSVLQILISITEGLIVNTFATLRDENFKSEDDQQNYCFICGLSRKDLERLGPGTDFMEHVQQRHNMWNYIFYMSYVQDKLSTEYTGIESYVAEKIDKDENSIEWFPKIQDTTDYGDFLDQSNFFFSRFQEEIKQRAHQLEFKVDKVRDMQLKQPNILKNINKQL